jgi:hypothetical protein
VIGRGLQFKTEGGKFATIMTRHLHFEDFNEPSPPPKTRRQSCPVSPARKRKPESPLSASEPRTKPPASANTTPSGPTTARKAGEAAKGVAEGLAAGLGTELAIGFVAGATGVAASTICLILLPIPIYAIATHWDEVTATASRLYKGKGTLLDYRAAGGVAGGLLSIGAAGPPTGGSATEVGIEAGQAVGEALRALSGNESEERRGKGAEVGVTRTYPSKQSFSRRAL